MERMVAWNGHVSDDEGIIWCMVEENKPGYMKMVGKDALTAPWYLARWKDFEDKDGNIDRVAAFRAAEKCVDQWNEEQGFSRQTVSQIVASSMRLQG